VLMKAAAAATIMATVKNAMMEDLNGILRVSPIARM